LTAVSPGHVIWGFFKDKGKIMNTQQLKTLRLADYLESIDEKYASAELRRLHSVNAVLLNALNTLLPEMRGLAMVSPLMKTYVEICETAIAKAQE
jgi:hypothetical protein